MWITKQNCHRARTAHLKSQHKFDLSSFTDKLSRRCVGLAAFLHVGATPAQLAGRPLMLQTMEAWMVAGIAIVRSGIGCWREAAWWKARGWWKLSSAASLHRLATIDFLGTGPTLDPLQRPFIVPSIAIEGAWRGGARRWCWRMSGWASCAVMLTTPSLLVEGPKPLALAIIWLCRHGHWSRCRDHWRHCCHWS